MKCFICGENNFKVVYNLKTKKIIRCQNDGLFFSDSYFINHELYGEKYYHNSPYSTYLNRFYFESKIRKIKNTVKEDHPDILDVGCGWGNFISILEKNKLPYLGIDTSKKSIEICRLQNLNCQQTDLETLANKTVKKYTAITCFQVIEHLTNPLPFLKTAGKLLKKEGIILLTTPNNNSPLRMIFRSSWSVYNTDSHFVFFDKKSLNKTLILAGFTNINIKLDTPRFFTLKYILSRLKLANFIKKLPIPVPTDPFGDLEAIGYT